MRQVHDVVVPKDAKPARYVVDRVGTPDPANSQYFVMDIVNDFDARVAVARLGAYYRQRGKEQLSKEVFDALEETKAAHQAHVESLNPKQKKSTSKKDKVIT